MAGVALVASLAACGGDKKDPNTPQANPSAMPPPPVGGYPPGTAPNQGGYPQPQGQGGYPPPQGGYPQPQGPAPVASAAPAAGVLPGVPLDPALLQQIAAAGAAMMGGAGVGPAAGAPAGDPTEAAVKAAAAKDAAGMQPEGAITKDTFGADAHKGMMVTLQGGKCYAIVAASPAGQVTNVDLHLLAPPLYNLEAGKDDGTGPVAVIGKGSQALCPVVPMPVQYKLDIHAKAGQGTIGVQVFSKAK